MIAVHRLTHPDHPVFVNSDLIQSIDATPDTVVSLINDSKLVVIETPSEVLGLISAWRGSVVADAARNRVARRDGVAEIVHLSGPRQERREE